MQSVTKAEIDEAAMRVVSDAVDEVAEELESIRMSGE